MHKSYLFTPALKLDSLLKGHGAQSDVVVLDLEDSIHSSSKTAARTRIQRADIISLRGQHAEIGIRINSLSTSFGLQDAALIFELQKSEKSRIDSIFIPKIYTSGEVTLYRNLFSSLAAPVKLIPIIETTDAIDNIDEISSLSDALILGQADLSAEMYAVNMNFISYARARVCIAAARKCIPAIDTNSFELKDMERFAVECLAAKREGFTGKAAIHPCQISAINNVFHIPREELDRYASSIEKYNNSQNGFSIVDGQIIAPPFIIKAEKLHSAQLPGQ